MAVDPAELNMMATGVRDENVFTFFDYDALLSQFLAISRTICSEGKPLLLCWPQCAEVVETKDGKNRKKEHIH